MPNNKRDTKRENAMRWIWSTADQASVSFGNFLTITLAAHLLSGNEQATLVYGYAIYLGVLLLGVAMIFSAAPIIAVENAGLIQEYQRALTRLQAGFSIIASLFSALALAAFSESLNVAVSLYSIGGLTTFLLVQQLADYFRRQSYIFSTPRLAAFLSVAQLAWRVLAVLIVRPESAGAMFFLLAVGALPGALAALYLFANNFRTGTSVILPAGHWQLSRWSLINAPFFWMVQFSPILLTGALAGAGAAAALGSIRVLTTAANVFIEQLDTMLSVQLARCPSQAGRRKMIALAGSIGMIVWASVMVFMVLFGEGLLAVVLGGPYSEKCGVLLILWVGTGVYFLGKLTAVALRVARQPRSEFLGSVAGSAVLLLNLPGIVFGATGEMWGALTLLIAQTAVVAGQLLAGKYLGRTQG